ncbi:MAG: deoxyribonuclease IV, partial [Peptococcaceae bacterium]|nr:deoxyribonuclease IV [Peptococcaceae bacterium]
TTILLETMAGKGSEVGSRFEELRQIIDGVEYKNKVGVCLDTCHVYDAGYDIVNDLDGVLAEFDEVIGLDYLKAIHLNDSMNPISSHKDRHQKIGQGSLGLDAIVNIICHEKLRNLPFYLETPHDDLEGYGGEIALLRTEYQKRIEK